MGILKRLGIGLVICLAAMRSYGQLIDDIQTPKIVGPSPDAAALGKYGEIPVDKSTGIPNISIPLYEIKTPRFTLPISLSYHASGIKVEEISSWVGAGWALNAGGVITRSIIGLPDDGGLGYLQNTIIPAADIVYPDDYQYISAVLHKTLDTQPDNFFYNFNNHSGAFVFGQDKNPILIPYKPIRIVIDSSSNFHITDEDGINYNFSTQEHVFSSIPDMSATSSWYLTQMISADRSDTISFEYSTDTSITAEISYNFTQSVSEGSGNTFALQPMVSTSSTREYNAVRVSSILFKGGKVDFIAKGGRLDEGTESLDSVIVYNYNGSTNQYSRLKSFKLLTDYFYSTLGYPSDLSVGEADKHRLKLDGLVENDMNDDSVLSYHFDYNTGILPQVHSYAQDQWGYFNGQILNESLLQSQIITVANAGVPTVVDTIGNGRGGDRSVSPTDMQAGILQKITYPTGGSTVFAFECNKQEGVNLVDTTLNNTAISFIAQADTVLYTPTDSMLFSGGNIFHIQIRESSDNPSYAPAYVKIVQITGETSTLIDSIGADEHNNMDTMLAFSLVAGDQYELIAVAPGPTDEFSAPYAIITTTYQVQQGNLINVGGLRVSAISNYNSDGSLINTETYKYGNVTQSGGGVPIAFPTVSHFVHLSEYGFVIIEPPNPPSGGISTSIDDTYNNNSIYPLSTLNASPVGYPMVTVYHGDTVHNTGKTIYNYNIYPDSPFVVTTEFYDGVKPISVTWKDDGQVSNESDYRNNGNGTYTLVQNKGTLFSLLGKKGGIGTIIGYDPDPANFTYGDFFITGDTVSADVFGGAGGTRPLVRTQFYWFDYPISTGVRVPTSSSLTNYDSLGNPTLTDTTYYFYDDTTLYLPTRTVKIDSKGDTIKTYTYRPLDKAVIDSITTLSSTSSVAIDSMVARNIITPVIQQVQYNDSLFTELALTNYKIWDSNIIAPQTIQAKIGSNPLDTRLQFNAYDFRGNPLELQKTNDADQVYLWGYNGLYPVAKILNSTYATASGYVTQSVLDNPSSDGALRSQLNNLRSIPHAQVTGYTYEPLVGMTSQTDVQGRPTYYEYDAFQRLKRIRDQDSNIVKTYDYQYQFTNSCGSNCFIVAMQTLAGTNTLSYPVGVFDVNGKLLGNVTSQSSYVSLWNADTADSRVGTLAAGGDSLHFTITLNTGQNLPTITGCRYYQVDLAYSKFDAVRNMNAAYVDFGDSTGMYLGARWADTPKVLAPNTSVETFAMINYQSDSLNFPQYEVYSIHTYPDTSTKTITFYHNDGTETCNLDNAQNPATSLIKVKNLRGNLPQHTRWIGGSSYADPSMTSVAAITNWSSINSIDTLFLNPGDQVNGVKNISYPQDFLANDQGFSWCEIGGAADTSFKMSRLKTDWNTFFTNLKVLSINDYNWNNEDLSALINLWFFTLDVQNAHPTANIDNIINQIAAGAGQTISRGVISISYPGNDRTSVSQAAYELLKSKQWTLFINGVFE